MEVDSNLIDYEVDSIKICTFLEFLNIAKNSKIKIAVIYSPVLQKCQRIQEVEICRSICKFENIPFWDFSKTALFVNNSNYFHDPGHLNNNGAVAFSKMVIEKIRKENFN